MPSARRLGAGVALNTRDSRCRGQSRLQALWSRPPQVGWGLLRGGLAEDSPLAQVLTANGGGGRGRPGAGGGGSDFMCWAPGSGCTGQRRRPPVRGEWVLPRPVRTHQVLLLPTKNLDERSDVSDQGLNFMARIIHILKPQGNEKPCRSGQ